MKAEEMKRIQVLTLMCKICNQPIAYFRRVPTAPSSYHQYIEGPSLTTVFIC